MTNVEAAGASPLRTAVVADFARSELFDRTFQEGMALVEDAAGYLDGEGRQSAKLLSRAAAMAYAEASMRLTTRLMQVASWLLVQRAVREGDMAAGEACDDRYRIQQPRPEPEAPELGELPAGLLALVRRAERLHERVAHLDRRMYVEPVEGEAPNPVLSQLDRVRAAFGARPV